METKVFTLVFIAWGATIVSVVNAEINACSSVRCGFNTTCVMKTAQCLNPPCDPVASCVPTSELSAEEHNSTSTIESSLAPHNETISEAQQQNVTETSATCAAVMCAHGLTCIMKEVQCFRAPCNSIPSCENATASTQ